MSWTARTIGLILLGIYPAGLSAQDVSYPSPTPSADDVAPASYQPPAASQEKASADAQPQLMPPADKVPAVETAPAAMPLKPHAPQSRAETTKQPGGLQSVATVGGSLAIVLGIFFLIVWLLRRVSPGGLRILPGEAFEVLGRAPLANRQQVHLLRCGNKLLLVAVTATGTETLTEIADPLEVDRLTDLCRQVRSGNPAATFRQVFRQVEKQNV